MGGVPAPGYLFRLGEVVGGLVRPAQERAEVTEDLGDGLHGQGGGGHAGEETGDGGQIGDKLPGLGHSPSAITAMARSVANTEPVLIGEALRTFQRPDPRGRQPGRAGRDAGQPACPARRLWHTVGKRQFERKIRRIRTDLH
jgi:hypothetical protein